MVSLISSGKISEALRNELQNMGLWDFVKSVYMVTYRIGQIFSGVWEQVKVAFSGLSEAFYPVFNALYEIIAPVGRILFSLVQALGLVSSAVPSDAFKTFGQIIGWLVGTPLKMLAWGIGIILSPIELLGKFIGTVLNTVSAIPEFLLPKGMEGLQKQLTAGSLALTMAATPAITTVGSHPSAVGSQNQTADFRLPTADENLYQSRLLAEKNTNYYQTFNNQRTENTNITPSPPVNPSQQPLEVKLHLDGREIYRSMINKEREYGVRSNG
ncbi:MAG: hypothetical protein HZA78_07550 [Candidatus Schekmanbacteria bacterium]|nr:hypothetical protein [Candidatus Schekmanbacteria bacterium]